jgi:hypothetical protein
MSNSFEKAINIGVCVSFVQGIITKHPLLSGDLFMYMAIIRGAISDATFDRVYMYDQQFRLRMSLHPTNSWSQIDGTLCAVVIFIREIKILS